MIFILILDICNAHQMCDTLEAQIVTRRGSKSSSSKVQCCEIAFERGDWWSGPDSRCLKIWHSRYLEQH